MGEEFHNWAEQKPQYVTDHIANGNLDQQPENHVGGADGTMTIKHEPIAVVGMDLTFPQDATSPAMFWEMLMEGKSGRSGIPKDRYNIDAFYHAGEKKTGTLNVKDGYFIREDIAAFDAAFFSISPAEAKDLDPMQRILLETTYKAFESAGLRLDDVKGSNTSVYIGSFLREYLMMLDRDIEIPQQYKVTGNSMSMLANRISWFFDLKGPSIALDTACSSSLSALHLACQGIRSGEASMSVVGGCSLLFNPETSISLADMNFLSPDGISYSFDHRANGYARGEGFGIVIIKPLSKALEDGNIIRAVIRSTGANQDGRTPGITQPSGQAQEKLIRQTYQAAGLDLAKTAFFEAHGTGTSVGDPIEASAIGTTFADAREHGGPLYIGAVKSNIGHLEGASGVASLIKTVLALEKAIIPPNIWFERINPNIDAKKLNLQFPTEPVPWPSKDLRRSSCNSFGFGGANAHVVIDDAYNYLRLRRLSGKHNTRKTPPLPDSLADHHVTTPISANSSESDPEPKLLVWSAAEQDGLKRIATNYAEYLCNLGEHQDDEYLSNLAYTLSEKRTRLPWKSFSIATSIDQLKTALLNGIASSIQSIRDPKLCFVFTGQGAQWYAMGRELSLFPTYKKSLDKAEASFKRFGCEWSLTEELLRDEEHSKLNDVLFSQPVCTAVQLAMVELLSSWGIKPSVVIGHSSGEIAAAYCAGSLSHDSACRVAYYRGVVAASLLQTDGQYGAMMAVGLSEQDIEPYLHAETPADGHISIGCFNSPRSLTLSGTTSLIDLVQTRLRRDGVFVRKLDVGVAYHSKQMKNVAQIYGLLLQGLNACPSNCSNDVVMISSVTGMIATPETLRGNNYWVQNLVSPVRFSQAVKTLMSLQPKNSMISPRRQLQDVRINHILEIGPHSVLRGAIRDILASHSWVQEISYGTVLKRNESATITAMNMAGDLFCLGLDVDIAAINAGAHNSSDPQMLIDLPSYPFNHTKAYWTESRLSKDFRFRQFPPHELLGTQIADRCSLEPRWRHIIRLAEHSWIKDHMINSEVVYPAAGMLVMAMEATRQILEPGRKPIGFAFRDISLEKALRIPSSNSGVEVQLYLRPSGQKTGSFLSWCDFRLCVCEGAEWSQICQGAIAPEYADDQGSLDGEIALKVKHAHAFNRYQEGFDRCRSLETADKIYENLATSGLNFGPSFRALRNLSFNDDGEACGFTDTEHWKLHTSDTEIQHHVIHPSALDTIFQLAFVALTDGGKKLLPTMVPIKIRNMWISATDADTFLQAGNEEHREANIKLHARSQFHGMRNAQSSILALDAKTNLVRVAGDLEIVVIGEVDTSQKNNQLTQRQCYNVEWKPDLDVISEDQLLAYHQCEASSTRPLLNLRKEKILLINLSLQKLLFHDYSGKLLKSKPHLLKYLDWARFKSSDLMAGTHRGIGGMENLQEMVRNQDVEGQLIVRVADNLNAIFSGEVEPLELLFKDDIMSKHYQFLNKCNSAFSDLLRYIDTLVHKRPDLKILEIGAGTGSATEGILNTLMRTGTPRFSQYAFTDISPSFFEDAKAKFENYGPRVVFKKFDVETAPEEQGWNSGEYDLVIASNAIHVCAKLEDAIGNVRRVLKPGGKLIMFEYTTNGEFIPGFMFGLLPGWWLGTEKVRQMGATVSRATWNTTLSNCGMSGIDIAFPIGETYGCSTIISTALDSDPRVPTPGKFHIVTSSESKLQFEIATNLKELFEMERFCDCDIITMAELALESCVEEKMIFLLGTEDSFLPEMTGQQFETLQRTFSTAATVLWVWNNSITSEDPRGSQITGLARTVRSENPGVKFVTIEFRDPKNTASVSNSIWNIWCSTISSELYEPEYRAIDGILNINRIVEDGELNQILASRSFSQRPQLQRFDEGGSRRLKLAIAVPGAVDSLHFTDDEIDPYLPLQPHEVEVRVMALGLNFRDVLTVLGQQTTSAIGMECSGVVVRTGSNASDNFRPGDRVCCMKPGSMRSYIRCNETSVVKIPDSMSFSTAAALPVVYGTAWYAIVHSARLKAKETILIHSGAGGFGQACIQVARLLGAEIITTVSSEEKKRYLIETYGIEENHIFSSRTPNFVQGVSRITEGRGADVIINTLANEALRCSWECIGQFGRFIEAGKKDIDSFGNLPMHPFSRNTSFMAIDFVQIERDAPKLCQALLKTVIGLFSAGKITAPSPLEIYTGSQIEQAFRYLESGKSIGKLILQIQDEDIVPIVPALNKKLELDPKATYLIAGGLGGLGRSVARWMVNRGAKSLILLSRSKLHNDAAKRMIIDLREKGIQVATPRCDISNQESLMKALDGCKAMPPVRGCIQSSMVLKDAMFEKMSHEEYNAALAPKVLGSFNLSKCLPRTLDFFIMFSSFSGIIGNHGQANYAAGNTYQDNLAATLHRLHPGQNAVALDLGNVADVGYTAEHNISGMPGRAMSEYELHILLEHFCNPLARTAVKGESQVITGIQTIEEIRAAGLQIPWFLNDPLFRQVRQMKSSVEDSPAFNGDGDTFLDMKTIIRSAESVAEAANFIIDGLQTKLSRTLAMEKVDIDVGRPMHIYGVDSLSAVEVRTWFRDSVGADVAVFKILGNESIASLAGSVAAKSRFLNTNLVNFEDKNLVLEI